MKSEPHTDSAFTFEMTEYGKKDKDYRRTEFRTGHI